MGFYVISWHYFVVRMATISMECMSRSIITMTVKRDSATLAYLLRIVCLLATCLLIVVQQY